MKRFQQKSYALGSEALLTLVVEDEAAIKSLFQAIWAQIRVFDERFSRFKSNSELSQFNSAAGEDTPISPAFKSLLIKSQQLSKATNGLYNPFVLPALQRAGYIGSWPTPEKHDENLNYSSRKIVPADKLVINKSSAHIPANSALDFGGIGKGYLLDQLADFLGTQHVKGYWLSLGGDIICGGFDAEKQPWKIGIADSQNPEILLEHITNQSGKRLAIATSGTTKRKGENWHHIIDPRTAKPAKTDIRMTTLTYNNATAADVYATCAVILGSNQAELFIKQHDITTTLLQIGHNDLVQVKRYGDLR